MVALSCPSTRSSLFNRKQTATQPREHARVDSLDDFNQLVLEHQDAVYRQALWILGEEEAAEDATQEAFIRAYHHMDSYNGGPFRPWILRITTNYCLDQLRRRKTHPTVTLEAHDEYDEEMEPSSWMQDPDACVEEIIERAEVNRRIMQSIQRLSPEGRAAVILVDLQGMDYQEAAASLGVNLGTFKSRLSRARLQLQKWLN